MYQFNNNYLSYDLDGAPLFSKEEILNSKIKFCPNKPKELVQTVQNMVDGLYPKDVHRYYDNYHEKDSDRPKIQFGLLATKKAALKAYQKAHDYDYPYKNKYKPYSHFADSQIPIRANTTWDFNKYIAKYLDKLDYHTIKNLINEQQLWFYFTYHDIHLNETITYIITGICQKLSILQQVISHLDYWDFKVTHVINELNCLLTDNEFKQAKTFLTKVNSFGLAQKDQQHKLADFVSTLNQTDLNNTIVKQLVLKIETNQYGNTLLIDIPEIQAEMHKFSPAQRQMANNQLIYSIHNMEVNAVNLANDLLADTANIPKELAQQKLTVKQTKFAADGFDPLKLKAKQLKQAAFSQKLQKLNTKEAVVANKKTTFLFPGGKDTLYQNYLEALRKKLALNYEINFDNANDNNLEKYCFYPHPIQDEQKVMEFYAHYNTQIYELEQFSYNVTDLYDDSINAKQPILLMVSTLSKKQERKFLTAFFKEKLRQAKKSLQPNFNYNFEQISYHGYNLTIATPIIDLVQCASYQHYPKYNHALNEYHFYRQQDKQKLIANNIPIALKNYRVQYGFHNIIINHSLVIPLIAYFIPIPHQVDIYQQNVNLLKQHDPKIIKQLTKD